MRMLNNIPLSMLDMAEVRKSLSDDSFLNKEHKLFPVKNADGTYNLNMIKCAIAKTAEHGYKKEHEKATALYRVFAEDDTFPLNITKTFKLSDVLEADKNDFWYLALPYGTFVYHAWWGDEKLAITEGLCTDMVNNFNEGIPHYGVPVKTGHGNDPKWGDVDALEASDEGLKLHCVLFDDKASRVREGHEYEYMSIEYNENYTDPKDGDPKGACVVGIALTNQPAHPDVPKIAMSETVTPFDKVNDILTASDKEWSYCQLSDNDKEDSKMDEELKKQLEESKKLSESQASELEQMRKELAETRKAGYAEKVDVMCKKLSDERKVSPAVAGKIKDFALSMMGAEITLSDNGNESKFDAIQMFESIFAEAPEIGLSQSGTQTGENLKEEEELKARKAMSEGIAGAASRSLGIKKN